MKIEYTRDPSKPAAEAELFRIGAALVLEVQGTLHQMELSRSQWDLLRDSAMQAMLECDRIARQAKRDRRAKAKR
jgi:hypothetical protein